MRPSFKRHSSDISGFVPYGLDRHFHPRVEENLQTRSKLHFSPHFYPLSTVNEVNSTSPSPVTSIHTPIPKHIPSVVINEANKEDDSDSDSVVQEHTGHVPSEETSLESAQVQEHCDKHDGEDVNTAEGIADTEPTRVGSFSPASRTERNQVSFKMSRQSSMSSANSFPSPKGVQRRKDHRVNQQQETPEFDSMHPQQKSETVDSNTQEKEQRRNQDGCKQLFENSNWNV